MNIQVHLKKIEYCEKYIYFFYFSKSETFIYSRFITCKVKHFKSFFFVLILMNRAYNIRIFPKINNKKKILQNRKVPVL